VNVVSVVKVNGELAMKNKTLNTCLLLAVVVLLGVCAFYVRIGATADAVVVLKTTGMSCGKCASTVTDALQSVKGVAATEVDLARGCVMAGYDSKLVAPEKLAQKVASAGFGSTVQAVLTPEQYKKISGHDICTQAASGGCCCGAKNASK
jgi:copper chaperone CopZ